MTLPSFIRSSRSLLLGPRRLFQEVSASLLVLAIASSLGVARTNEAQFVIDTTQSDLTIAASTNLGVPLSDSDTQSLQGFVTAVFDFGSSGSFPANAGFSIDSADISPLAPFQLVLGTPPFSVNVAINGAGADVTTPSPPVDLTQTALPGVVYEFDASNFDVTLNQGTVEVSGLATQTIDLAAEPASGTAPAGTTGTLTLTPGAAVGPYVPVDGLLELPITFQQTLDVSGQAVTLDVDGQVVANSSFFVTLSPIPGDFDGDLDVDGDDRAIWERHYGVDGGADADNDNDTDGDDFVLWQRNHGLAPPTVVNATTVPEPSMVLLATVGAMWTAARRRRR